MRQFFLSRIHIVIFTLLLVLLFGGVYLTRVLAQSTQVAQLLFNSQVYDTQVSGDQVTMKIGMDTPQMTVGADIILRFETQILEVTGVTVGGTQLKTLAPLTPGGAFDLSKAISHPDASTTQLEFSLVAYDPSAQAPTTGIQGNFNPNTDPLVEVTFTTLQPGRTNVQLFFQNSGNTTDSNVVSINGTEINEILGGTIPSSLVNVGKVCVYDFNASNKVDVIDILSVSNRWNTHTGDPNYDARYDIDADGDIDIVDIQKVANEFNNTCE